MDKALILFSGGKDSLIRAPKGITSYNTKEFNDHCEQLSSLVFNQIESIISSGYKILAIMGIEQSPSCCVNYIYTNKGMENRSGLFIEKLKNKTVDYHIPYIGINRKYINKSLKELKNIIDNINLNI